MHPVTLRVRSAVALLRLVLERTHLALGARCAAACGRTDPAPPDSACPQAAEEQAGALGSRVAANAAGACFGADASLAPALQLAVEQ